MNDIPPPSIPPIQPPRETSTYVGTDPDQDSKNLSMLAHILNFTLLGPLLIYLLKKDTHPFVNDQAKEALNFSLCCLIIHVICSATAMFCIPAIISLLLFLAQIVFGIIGGLKARDGVAYRYPLVIRFIK